MCASGNRCLHKAGQSRLPWKEASAAAAAAILCQYIRDRSPFLWREKSFDQRTEFGLQFLDDRFAEDIPLILSSSSTYDLIDTMVNPRGRCHANWERTVLRRRLGTGKSSCEDWLHCFHRRRFKTRFEICKDEDGELSDIRAIRRHSAEIIIRSRLRNLRDDSLQRCDTLWLITEGMSHKEGDTQAVAKVGLAVAQAGPDQKKVVAKEGRGQKRSVAKEGPGQSRSSPNGRGGGWGARRVGTPRGRGLKGWSVKGWGGLKGWGAQGVGSPRGGRPNPETGCGLRSGGAQNFALFFFLLQPPFSFFFSLFRIFSRLFFPLSGGPLVNFWWLFWSVRTSNVLVFAFRLSCGSPRAPVLASSGNFWMCRSFCFPQNRGHTTSKRGKIISHAASPTRTIRRGAMRGFLNDAMSSMRCLDNLHTASARLSVQLWVLADGIPPRLTSSQDGAVDGRLHPSLHGGATLVCASPVPPRMPTVFAGSQAPSARNAPWTPQQATLDPSRA